jgi:hypothetical protein
MTERASVAAAVLVAGGHVGVAGDADEAPACLDAWGIPRAQRLVFLYECRGMRRHVSCEINCRFLVAFASLGPRGVADARQVVSPVL